MKKEVLIIGAGISGLSAGYYLKEKGFNVTILEADSEPGGTMKTKKMDGFLVEHGPNSTLETTPLFREMFAKLGISDKMIYASESSSKRYVLRNNKLHEVPMSPGLFLKSKLFSVGGKARMFLEPFYGKGKSEETVAQFVSRRLGNEFLNYAINPFVAGVYAGDPAALSVRAAFPKLYALETEYGGIFVGSIKGAKKRKQRTETSKVSSKMFSFTEGMGTLPDTLSKQFGDSLILNAVTEKIEIKDGKYTAFFLRNGQKEKIESDILILAIPAHKAAKLVSPLSTEISDLLMKIYYPAVSEIVFGLKNENVHLPMDGFGFLIPEMEGKNILGAIWNSAIYSGRVPEGMSMVTIFMGGARNPEKVILPESEQLKIAFQDIKEIMKIKGEPAFSYITKWEKAIPQYNLGHLSIVEQLRSFEKQQGSLYFCANYLGGISVADCVMSANDLSNRISKEHNIPKEK